MAAIRRSRPDGRAGIAPHAAPAREHAPARPFRPKTGVDRRTGKAYLAYRRASPQEAAPGPRRARRRGRRFRRDEGSGSDRPLSQGGRDPAHGRFRPAHPPVLGSRGDGDPQCVGLARSNWGGVLGRRPEPLSRYGFMGRRAGTCVDLHWRPAASIATHRHAEGVRERAVAAGLEGRPVLVASATDHLFIVLCHAFYDDLERRNEWIADLDLLFRLVPPEEWDWRLFHRLAQEHQIDRWMRKALATTQAITGDPRPRAPSRFWGPRRRGEDCCRIARLPCAASRRRSPFDRKARSNGRKARGFADKRSTARSNPSAPSSSPSRASL